MKKISGKSGGFSLRWKLIGISVQGDTIRGPLPSFLFALVINQVPLGEHMPGKGRRWIMEKGMAMLAVSDLAIRSDYLTKEERAAKDAIRGYCIIKKINFLEFVREFRKGHPEMSLGEALLSLLETGKLF